MYSQGSNVEDSGVYFILNGEFEMTQTAVTEVIPDFKEEKFKEKVSNL